MSFAQTLGKIMKEKNITAYRLSKQLGVHQTTISNWLNGKSTPRSEMLPHIANALGVSEFEFTSGNEDLESIISFLRRFGHSNEEIKATIRMYQSIKKDLDPEDRIEISHDGSVSICSSGSLGIIDFSGPENQRDILNERLRVAFNCMNEVGQKKAVEQVEDLAKIPDYQKKADNKE